MTQSKTKDQILDAAEYLFSTQGFYTTSLREITGQAGVNLAAVNYHFRTKDKLVKAVLKRRLVPINKIRLDMLEKELVDAKTESRKPRVKPILKAFIQPTFSLIRNKENPAQIPGIIARAHTDPDSAIRDAFFDIMAPIFKQFFQALCQAMPETSVDSVGNRMMFTIGSMAFAVMSELGYLKIKPETEGKASTNMDDLIEQLLEFVAHGMEGA